MGIMTTSVMCTSRGCGTLYAFVHGLGGGVGDGIGVSVLMGSELAMYDGNRENGRQ